MRRRHRFASALVVAGALSMLAARPVLADHDHDDDHWHHGHGHHEHHERHEGWYDSRHYSYGGYHRYYEPRVEYYSDPVYVPPPPSFGLNLVFPIH